MSELVLAIGAGLSGVSIGYLLGLVTKRFTNPSVKELQKALELSEDNYKRQLARFRGRIREYEQPPEIMQISNQTGGEVNADSLRMLAQNLPSIKGLPKWVRPFVPAIQSFITENPDKVKDIVGQLYTRFGRQGGQGESGAMEDSL